MHFKTKILLFIGYVIFCNINFIFTQPKTHTIQLKETLYSISKKYGVTVEDIANLNKIKEPYIIHPGDVLQIPETKNNSDNVEVIKATTKQQAEIVSSKSEGENNAEVKAPSTVKIEAKPIEISQATIPTKTGKRNYLVITKTNAYLVKPDVSGNPVVISYSPVGANYKLLGEVGEYFKVKHLYYGEVYIWKKQSYKILETANLSPANSAEFLKYAASFYGVPYVMGGSSPSSFDCSGFTQYVFAHFGIKIPRVSKEQFLVGEPVSIDNLYGGDLLFFGDKDGVSHVAMYWGNGYFIHASSGYGAVVFTQLTKEYYSKNFIGAKRIVVGKG